MRRARSFLTNLIPFAAAASGAALLTGPLSAEGFGGTEVRFEGARAGLTACQAADTSLEGACALIAQKDPAFRPLLDAGHVQLLDAIHTTRDTAWPRTLRRVRTKVGALLTAAESRLDRTERLKTAPRLRTVKNYAQAARRKLARAEVLLQDVVPPNPPDLDHKDTTPATPVEPPQTSPDFTWTEFTKSSDTKVYYVSDSTGNDANDGLSPEKPIKTPMVAYAKLRNGYPDWMLLKRGDVWDGTAGTYAFVGGGDKSGRSASEPLVISTYGSSTDRPLLIDGRFRCLTGMSHVALVGMQFKLSGPKALITFGVSSLGAKVTDFLVEDCLITGYGGNIQADGQGTASSNLRIRGCVIADAIIQGTLLTEIDGLLIEGCVFDHNGWREGIPGFERNGFNHNMYIQTNCSDVTVRNTITARASSHGLQQRPGGLTEDNLFLQNPIGMNSFGDGKVRGNVFLDSADIGDAYRGMGIWLGSLKDMEVYENIVAHQVQGSQAWAMAFDSPTTTANLNIHDNIVYKWDGASPVLTPTALYFAYKPYGTISVKDNTFHMAGGQVVSLDHGYASNYTFSGNRYYSTAASTAWFNVGQDPTKTTYSAWIATSGEKGASSSPVTFPAPERTIETYSASLGKAATLDAFMTEARKQSRSTWKLAYTAKTANNYFRAGFGLSPR